MSTSSKWRKRQRTAFLVFLLAFLLFGALVWRTQREREAAVAAITQSEALQKAQARISAQNSTARQNRKQHLAVHSATVSNEIAPAEMQSGPFGFERIVALMEKEEWKWWLAGPFRSYWELTDDEKERLGRLLQQNEPLLDHIRALAAAGLPDYEVNLSIESLGTHWGTMMQFSRLLAAQCAYELEKGQTAKAFESLRAVYQMGEILAGEPIYTSQTIRGGIHLFGFENLQRFPSGSLTTAQLDELSRLVASPDFTADFSDSWYTNAYMGMERFQNVREGGNFLRESNNRDRSWLMTLYGNPLARPLLNLDETNFCQTMDRCATLARLPFYEALPELEALENEVDSLLVVRVLNRPPRSYFLHAFELQAAAIARSQLAHAALQIEQYHDQHGAYPDSLRDVGVTSLDPFSGGEYIYERGQDTFRLYSVGRNQQEGGGTNEATGNLVWQSTTDRRNSSYPAEPVPPAPESPQLEKQASSRDKSNY